MLINDKPIFIKWYFWETGAWLIFMIICYTINYLFFMDSHYSQSWLILTYYTHSTLHEVESKFLFESGTFPGFEQAHGLWAMR